MNDGWFDQAIDRKNTHSIRWDKYGPDVIPLWVADMDFRPPPAVSQALQARLEHGIFGYSDASTQLKVALVDYMQKKYGWHIDSEWVTFLPGVVTGLHLAVRTLTEPTDHVLIPHPAYDHFKKAVQGANRAFSTYDMKLQDGRYYLDLAQLETLLLPNTRLLMLCNPHNPGGTVFSKKELQDIADFAKAHQLVICADEIHADVILDEGIDHTPIGSIGHGIEERSVALMSLNKAYNFPGIGLAWEICQNPLLQKKLMHDVHTLIPHPHLFAYTATQAALRDGADWHRALLRYLKKNRDLVEQRIKKMPGLSMAHSPATYLAWIDATQLGVADPHGFFLQHGVALSPGQQFGAQHFIRLNFGTQYALLDQALLRMERACREILQ